MVRKLFSLAILGTGLASLSFSAIIYSEVGDAGESLATANFVNTFPGGTTLDAIQGNLEAPGADMYRIYLKNGQTFTASTGASSFAFNNFDSILFLFDSTGLGVVANDDDGTFPPQSFISFTPGADGIYYLAISGSNYLPFSAGGGIFPTTAFPPFLDPGIVGPTGPGGASVLSGWSSPSSETGAYEIVLTNAEFLPSAGVPEPATVVLMSAGLLSLGLLRRRARR